VLLFPVIDTSKEGYGQAKIGERWQELSPAHNVRAGLPPTLIFHGTGDTVTPFAGAKTFHEAMLKAGNRCELDVNEGGAHGYLMRDKALFDDTMKKTDAFLKSLGLLP
jgi:acetyl esterase